MTFYLEDHIQTPARLLLSQTSSLDCSHIRGVCQNTLFSSGQIKGGKRRRRKKILPQAREGKSKLTWSPAVQNPVKSLQRDWGCPSATRPRAEIHTVSLRRNAHCSQHNHCKRPGGPELSLLSAASQMSRMFRTISTNIEGCQCNEALFASGKRNSYTGKKCWITFPGKRLKPWKT